MWPWWIACYSSSVLSAWRATRSAELCLLAERLLSFSRCVDWNSVHGGWGRDEKHVTRHLICLPEEGHDRKLIADASFRAMWTTPAFLSAIFVVIFGFVFNRSDVALMNSMLLVICSVCLKSDKISWIVPACRKAFVVQQMCWLKFCSWWMGPWWEACYSSSDLSPWRRTRSEADSWCLLPMCTAPAFLSEVFLVLLGFCVEQPWCGPNE